MSKINDWLLDGESEGRFRFAGEDYFSPCMSNDEVEEIIGQCAPDEQVEF